jgi:hypothetical protein
MVGVNLDLSFYRLLVAFLLRRRGVEGSWWRQRLFCFCRFSCLFVPYQPLSAVLAFLAPHVGLLLSWWLGLLFELL